MLDQVKSIYVKNLPEDVSEEMLREVFEQFGPLFYLKKFKSTALVKFEDAVCATHARLSLCDKFEMCPAAAVGDRSEGGETY